MLLAAAAAVPAAACDSSGSDSAAPGPATGCEPSPGVTADEVTLGLLYPDTGNAASLFNPFRAGVDARLGVANAAGGVHGRKISYIWRDDESTPAVNLSSARELVEHDQVFGILESSSAAAGSADYLHRTGVPVTGTSPEGIWSYYDNMFSYSHMIADGSAISTWGDFVAEKGGARAVIALSTFSTASIDFADELRVSLESAGVTVVGTVDATGPIDLKDMGERIRASGADTLVGTVTGAAFGQVVLAARAADVPLKVILSPTGYDQGLLDLFRTILADVYVFVDYQPFEMDTPAHRTFLAAMTEYAPYLQPPSKQAALAGWISTDMFLRGLEQAGPCPSRERFIAGLRAVRDYAADGLLPEPLDLTESFGHVGRCYTFLQVSPDGTRFQVVDPAPRCGRRLEN